MNMLQIPRPFWNWIARSFKNEELSLYGRFDLRYDGNGPAKLLEFNADTPTSAFETGVFQWKWLEDAIARKVLPEDADQFNSLHERLIEGWKVIGKGRLAPFRRRARNRRGCRHARLHRGLRAPGRAARPSRSR